MTRPDPTEAQMNALHDYRREHLNAQFPTSDTERTTPGEWAILGTLAVLIAGVAVWGVCWLSKFQTK